MMLNPIKEVLIPVAHLRSINWCKKWTMMAATLLLIKPTANLISTKAVGKNDTSAPQLR